MARIVEYVTSLASTSTINWDKFMDGRVWELRRNEDFSSTVTSFRAAFYAAAHKRGLVPFSRIVDKDKHVIHVQALPPDQVGEMPRRKRAARQPRQLFQQEAKQRKKPVATTT